MKRFIKVLLILGLCLVIVGGLLATVGLLVSDRAAGDGSADKKTEVTHTVDAPFTHIDAEAISASVRIRPAEGETVVRIKACEGLDYTVEVKDEALIIREEDGRKWYEKFGISLTSSSVEIWLPAGEYGELEIETVSGSVEIPAGYRFSKAEIENTSGTIRCFAGVTGSLEISTVSGGIEMKNCTPESLRAETVSGGIRLDSVLVEKKIRISSVSGGVGIFDCDAAELEIETVSGAVTGRLCSGKSFDVETTSGTVRVPQDSAGGRCRIETVSGSVRFE